MLFKISLVDWRGKETKVEFGFWGIKQIFLYEVTGDEVLKVVYDGGGVEFFDSSSTRRNDFIDRKICLYDKDNPENAYYTMEEFADEYLVEEE